MADGVEGASDTLWHGRFEGGPAEALMAFTVSLPFDQRLWEADIKGSQGHVRGLGRAGILNPAEVDSVLVALDAVAAEFSDGSFVFKDGDEDVHTAVERRVTEIAGDAGAKMHTARSRNDQVATDLRLWTLGAMRAVARDLIGLQEILLDRAQSCEGVYLPGYTHLQRAQPVLLAHHLLAHGWAFARDVDRIVDALERMDVSPLGAGALAGTSVAIDPVATAA
ncbi:MAG: lyase family protein, partial [Actinomycetota bacterium]|nr:lyase family protein [Actinomycetota bacterium]